MPCPNGGAAGEGMDGPVVRAQMTQLPAVVGSTPREWPQRLSTSAQHNPALLRTDAQSLWPLSRSRTDDRWRSCLEHSSHFTIHPSLCRVPIRTRHPHLRCFPIWAQRSSYLHLLPTLPHGVLGSCFSPALLPLSMSHSSSSFVLSSWCRTFIQHVLDVCSTRLPLFRLSI